MCIRDRDETGWGIYAGPGLRNQARKAVFNLAEPVTSSVLVFYLKQNHGGWNSDDNQTNNLGRVRLSITTAENAEADPLPAAVREILAVPGEQRTPEQTQTVFSYWRITVPEWRQQNDEIAALWKQYPEGASQLVMAQREEVRPTHVLTRGDFLKPAKAVEAGTPAYLNVAPTGTGDRLTFAKWLVDR